MPADTKATTLREKSKVDLLKQLDTLKESLAQLRVEKASQSSKAGKMKGVRRGIATVLTVLNEKQRLALKNTFSTHKYTPYDLRVRKTRAIRRKLSKEEQSAKTLKQKKKETHFPLRKYALRA